MAIQFIVHEPGDMGKPSKVVATEDGVPGVRMRQAELEPP